MHCPSRGAHNIATSKVSVIFTGRLKRGNKGHFCSANAVNSNFDNFTILKGVCLETRPSLLAQNDYLKQKLPLYFRLAMKRKRWPPLFYLCFLLVVAPKIYTLRRKNLDSRSCIFLDRTKVRDNVKTVYFSTFFQGRVILGHLTGKI